MTFLLLRTTLSPDFEAWEVYGLYPHLCFTLLYLGGGMASYILNLNTSIRYIRAIDKAPIHNHLCIQWDISFRLAIAE